MDFFQFLQNSKNEEPKKKVAKEKSVKFTKTVESDDNRKIVENTNDEHNIDKEQVTVYKNIVKGDMVKIVYLKDSILNAYKGYIGEVREYKRDQEIAIIFLHAITSKAMVKFPIEHFIKINNNM
jgi:hypothetical protein